MPEHDSISQINDLLCDRLEELLAQLVGGRRRGREWIAASTRQGGPGDSLGVALVGAKRGRWYWWARGVGGDPLGLIAEIQTDGDMRRAMAWARDFLGGVLPADTAGDAQRRERTRRGAEDKLRRERQASEGAARFLWFRKGHPIEGTPAWHYLDRRLGGRLARLGHVPNCLRYLPELYCEQVGARLPAMIAAIVAADGRQIGTHRTWLIERAEGWDRIRPGDYPTHDGRELMARKVLGSMAGGSIRVWAGNRIDSRTGEVRRGAPWPTLARGSAIVLAEGIETALTVALIMPQRRIVSTVSVAGFANIVLPGAFSSVTIAAENDGDNPTTAAAVERARLRHIECGRRCIVCYPPEPHKDWNSALNALDAEASDATGKGGSGESVAQATA